MCNYILQLNLLGKIIRMIFIDMFTDTLYSTK